MAGYIVLRYVILVATGVILYTCVRRFASTAVACTSVVLLALNPFYMRMVLWDYTSYVALPCAIAGVAIWLMAATRASSVWPFLGSGALLGAAVFANALSGTFVAALILVEVAAALRGGAQESQALCASIVAATAGAGLISLIGYLGYAAYLGAFDPYDLLEATVEFARANDQRSAPFRQPFSEFLDGEPRIWGPVLICFVLVVVLGRRVLANDLAGRLAQFALPLFFFFFFLKKLFRRRRDLVGIQPGRDLHLLRRAPLILDQFQRSMSKRAAYAAMAAAVAGTAVTTLVIRSRNSWAVSIYEEIRDDPPVLIVILAAGVVATVLLRALRHPAARAAAAGACFALLAFVSLTPARYAGIGQTGEFAEDGRTERLGYQAAYDRTKLIEGGPTSRIGGHCSGRRWSDFRS